MRIGFRSIASMVVGLMALQACGSARVFYQDREGGVLILEGDEGKALDDAKVKMASHCGPGRYEIVRREMVTVGTEAYASQRTDYGEREQRAKDGEVAETRTGAAFTEDEERVKQGTATTNAVSGVREVRETRITYACN